LQQGIFNQSMPFQLRDNGITIQQDRPRTYNVTTGSVRATSVAAENQ